MDIGKHLRLTLPLVLAGTVALLAFQFFFGTLGVVESWAKQQTLANMRQDILSLKAATAERQRQINLLSSDKGTIRSLALLYGMTGGEEVQPRDSLARKIPLRPPKTDDSYGKQPFFIRHPVLLVISGAILALVTGFFVSQRRRGKQQSSLSNRSRYIKPSWTA